MAEAARQILFVCTGNTCRSPMAVGLLEREVGSSGAGCRIRSAGVSAAAGLPASRGAIDAMREIGIDISGHRTEPVSRGLVDASILVVCTRAAA